MNDAAGKLVGFDLTTKSFRSICLKELYNGQCFGLLITESPNLKTLRLFKCSGDRDRLLEEVAEKVPGIVEIPLGKLWPFEEGAY